MLRLRASGTIPLHLLHILMGRSGATVLLHLDFIGTVMLYHINKYLVMFCIIENLDRIKHNSRRLSTHVP
jgi:hypothetical protein